MMKRWSPRASPLRLSQLSPLASEDDVVGGPRSGGCTVVLDQLPSELLESLSSDGHVRMSLPTPPDSVRGDDSTTSVVENDAVSELLRDMVDRLDTPVCRVRRKKKRKSKKSRHHHEHQERPRVSPIFVWVRQAEEGVIGEVWCEDYDKRNRLRLTKTPAGWRAIPRTHTLSEMHGALRRDSADSTSLSEEELSEREDGKVKVAGVQVDPEEDEASDLEKEVEVPEEEDEIPVQEDDALAQVETGPIVPEKGENDPEEDSNLEAPLVEEEDLSEEEDTLENTPDGDGEEEDESESEEILPEEESGVVSETCPDPSVVAKDKCVDKPKGKVEESELGTEYVPVEDLKCITLLTLKGYSFKKEVPEEEELTDPEQVADLSAKKREPGPLPCRSPLIRLPPLPRKPLPSPVLQQPPCEYRTPSPAHQAMPVALPGVPRQMQSPLPAHVHDRPLKRTLDTPEVPAKRQKSEPTLRELLREKKQESRLMELLTTSPATTPKRSQQPSPVASLDALAQLRLVMSQLRVPDPLLIPQSRLSALLASPATEIPRLLAMPPAPLSPDVIPVALDRLQALLRRSDSDLLAWAAQDWALPKPPAWPPSNLAAYHLAAMGFCVPPPMETWHTPPQPCKQMQFTPAVAAPMKNHPPAQGPPKPRIACKALSDLMPKKNKQAQKPSGPLVSPPPGLTVGLQGATRNLPQLWHPLFGSHTSDSWNWRKTVPVHGD